jgi:hypothetical protein
MTSTLARLAAATTIAASLIPATQGLAHGKLPTGRYNCYVFYSPGVPTYTGRYIVIKSAHTYRFYNGKSTRGGEYVHRASGKLRFTSGPLKGMAGKHRVYGNGTSGVNITFRTSAGPSDYSCSPRSG